jgi:hypothetical protein
VQLDQAHDQPVEGHPQHPGVQRVRRGSPRHATHQYPRGLARPRRAGRAAPPEVAWMVYAHSVSFAVPPDARCGAARNATTPGRSSSAAGAGVCSSGHFGAEGAIVRAEGRGSGVGGGEWATRGTPLDHAGGPRLICVVVLGFRDHVPPDHPQHGPAIRKPQHT